MYCPQCRSEYKPDISECYDCKIPLVETLPDESEPQFIDLVTIFKSADTAKLLIAKSLLEEANIPYYPKGEGLQDLFGAGRIGTGYNLLVGPVELQVDKSQEQNAQNVLKDIN